MAAPWMSTAQGEPEAVLGEAGVPSDRRSVMKLLSTVLRLGWTGPPLSLSGVRLERRGSFVWGLHAT